MRRLLLGLSLLAVSVAPACSGKTRQLAEAATAEFRQRYARAAFDEIYAASAPSLWTFASHDEFLKLMTTVNRRLGSWRSATPAGWEVTSGTGGTLVKLRYQSLFEKGPASEEFDWDVDDKHAALDGYHINSPIFFDP